MSKTSGVAWTTLTLDSAAPSAIDIRNDVTNFNFATPRTVADWTGVDKSAIERGLLLADFSGTLNGIFNPAVSHSVLKTVSSSDVVRTLALGIASQTLSNEVLVTDYQLTRGTDGNLPWAAPFSLANGAIPTWS